MIRSSKHTIKFANYNKQQQLTKLLVEYRRVAKIIYPNIHALSIVPKHMNYKPYKIQTWLSARILRRLTDQLLQLAIGIRRSQNKNAYPNLDNINLCLDLNNYDIQSSRHFDAFIRIKYLGNKQTIKIPVKYHRQYHKLASVGRRLGGIEISSKWIKLNFEIAPTTVKIGRKIGIDQGRRKVITTSDSQCLPTVCRHGHTLESILQKLAKRKKNSNGFKRAQEHRKNFINWSINHLNFTGVKVIGFEKLNIFKKTGRVGSHWAYGLIRKKVCNLAEEHGVRVVEQSAAYRSQRCSSCGWVIKSNRNGANFKCNSCGFTSDADVNAALNHAAELVLIPFGQNVKNGFYWLESDF